MIIEEKKLILKNGQACILRSPRLEDAEQLIEYLKITAGETDFLLKYPEEVKITVEQEKDILQWFIEGRKIRIRHRCSLGIALHEKYWGLGIGTVLLELLLEKASECGYDQIELDVVSRNERAIALYEKIGFEKFGIRPKAMKHKDGTYDDEIMMVNYLQNEFKARMK